MANAQASQRVGDLGALLGVWAHPDDEAYLSAGLMATAVDAGRRVVSVAATDGEAHFSRDDPRTEEERRALRRAERHACLEVLDVADYHSLGHADGACDAVTDESATAQIAALIEAVQPNTVLTSGPDGGTGHRDHVAVCRWTTNAVRRLSGPRPRLLYATKTIDWDRHFVRPYFDRSMITAVVGLEPETLPVEDLAIWFTSDDATVDRKLAALRAQTSQLEPLLSILGAETYRELLREEAFRDPRSGDDAIMAHVRSLPLR